MDIETIEQFWDYMENVITPNVNDKNNPLHNKYLIIGAARLQQVRKNFIILL